MVVDAYERETDRLFLRRWRAEDLDDLTVVFAKPEVWWYPDRRGWNADETRAFLDRRIDALAKPRAGRSGRSSTVRTSV